MDESGNGCYMKLLFVHQHFGALGGAEANIQITASELQKRGHEIALLHQTRTGRSEESWRETFPETFQLPKENRLARANAILKQFAPDVIYLHNLDDLNVMEALMESSVPVIRKVHDHSMYCMRGYKYNPLTRAICTRPASLYCVFPCMASVKRNRGGVLPLKLASYAATRREIRINRRCKRLLVYSDYSKAELIRNGFEAEKIHLHVPMRCWGQQGPVSSFSERNLILFAGQIIRGKGVDLLLKALAKVTTPFECVILGDGHHRAFCERLCKKLGLADRVHFRGFVPTEELQKFYLDASVFAVTSVWPEPFGLVGPEAMRYGLPVVAFDAGGISEWLKDGENGYLAPWMDTGRFALCLDKLLRNKTLAREFGQRGLERVNREYDASLRMAELENLFHEVIAETGNGSKTKATRAGAGLFGTRRNAVQLGLTPAETRTTTGMPLPREMTLTDSIAVQPINL
jgi:glycosyltransferase involved in cell wall biosynthesis